MKPLTFETLEQIVATKTVTLEFPGSDMTVTVRPVTPEETKRAHEMVTGRDPENPATEADVQVMLASIAITTADFDSDEGRAKLAKLPRAMMQTIANAIYGMMGADGEAKKN